MWTDEMIEKVERLETEVARLRAALVAIDDRAERHNNVEDMRGDIRALVAGALRT